jgi:GH24 family phage-related lysozyme (muramidase)
LAKKAIGKTYNSLPEQSKVSVISYVFNAGNNALYFPKKDRQGNLLLDRYGNKQFDKSKPTKFLQHMRAGNYAGAVKEMDIVTSKGKEEGVPGLKDRRISEQENFLKGIGKNDRRAKVAT